MTNCPTDGYFYFFSHQREDTPHLSTFNSLTTIEFLKTQYFEKIIKIDIDFDYR